MGRLTGAVRFAPCVPGEGERALMRAVLQDAIRCLAGEVGSGEERLELARQARDWVASHDQEWPFSFEHLCDGLGLDAARLRPRLLRMPVSVVPDWRERIARRASRDDQIRSLHRAGWTLAALAAEFGVGTMRIGQICRRGVLAGGPDRHPGQLEAAFSGAQASVGT
jgi:hypothetical protein